MTCTVHVLTRARTFACAWHCGVSTAGTVLSEPMCQGRIQYSSVSSRSLFMSDSRRAMEEQAAASACSNVADEAARAPDRAAMAAAHCSEVSTESVIVQPLSTYQVSRLPALFHSCSAAAAPAGVSRSFTEFSRNHLFRLGATRVVPRSNAEFHETTYFDSSDSGRQETQKSSAEFRRTKVAEFHGIPKIGRAHV